MFYEFIHKATPDYFITASGGRLEFPAHIHECFELIVVTKGELKMMLDKAIVTIKKGEGVLIFPNLIHSMLPNDCEFFINIFSPFLVTAFYSKVSDLIPDNFLFKMPEHLLNILRSLGKNSSKLAKKGFLYLLCDHFNQGRNYIKQKNDQKNVLGSIFKFIENNYNGDCTLKSLSKHLGYEYTYLSRIFKEYVGISFNNYVNFYRLNNACYLFENTKQSITDCAHESGYTSVRSFNRNFKNQFGVTPSEYTKNREK